ncbi:MAG: hypothetical protein AABY22_12745 [Nanoarchaeota archaeon]
MTNQRLLENTRQFRKTPKGVLTNIYQHQKARSKRYGYELDYSLKELHKMFLQSNKFLRIWRKWKQNGYKYYDKPSIDRKDANVGYTKKNVQMMTWRQNRVKGNKEVSLKKLKPIIALDLDGNKVKAFPSIKSAVMALGLNQGLISSVLTGKRKHTGGYKFIYENPELLK